MRTIYYLIPDLQRKEFKLFDFLLALGRKKAVEYLKIKLFRKAKPVGGIKVSYQHCLMLKEEGYDAYPLLMGKYVGNFFGYDIESKHINEVGFNLTSNDIVVASEFFPYHGLQFKNAKKVLFMQNWANLGRRFTENEKGKTYFDLGYDHVITCGAYCTNMVLKKMGITATTITNGIDQRKFFEVPELRIENRILALSRKNPKDLKKIMDFLEGSPVDFQVIDGLTERELIKEYQKADIFLATGYPEGFGLPPLEAMNCGCVVVGFTGGGASEYMIDHDTALVAEDGDCAAAAGKLLKVLNDKQLKEKIRANGLKKAKAYTLENTKQQLLGFYKTISS